ncbi:MAG: hypothetical protein K2W96_02545, partial [Gemmataceae bacterium]|nr:hypothetical protein [Gemmataceae bacterium]
RLRELCARSYEDARVTVVNEDALVWLDGSSQEFDAVLIDFPDPHSFALGKLYTTRFYSLLRKRMADGAALAIQATSPLTTRRSYWCIVRTLSASGFAVRPYQASVPSFGVWGFALAKKEAFPLPAGKLPEGLRYLDGEVMRSLFTLPPDVGPVEVRVNRLDNQHLVRYYETERK